MVLVFNIPYWTLSIYNEEDYIKNKYVNRCPTQLSAVYLFMGDTVSMVIHR